MPRALLRFRSWLFGRLRSFAARDLAYGLDIAGRDRLRLLFLRLRLGQAVDDAPFETSDADKFLAHLDAAGFAEISRAEPGGRRAKAEYRNAPIAGLSRTSARRGSATWS
jgi:hypothetical protein